MLQKIFVTENTKLQKKKEFLYISGPKGCVKIKINKMIQIIGKNQNILIKYNTKKEIINTLQTKISNAIIGVTKGFFQILKLNGIGYKVHKKKDILYLKVGTAHNKLFQIPQNIQCKTIRNKTILLYCINKELLKQTVDQITKIKKPDVYKGKGIIQENELIITKEGKKNKKNTPDRT